jgi:hypothetical protein
MQVKMVGGDDCWLGSMVSGPCCSAPSACWLWDGGRVAGGCSVCAVCASGLLSSCACSGEMRFIVDASLLSVVYPFQRLLSAVCVASCVSGVCDFPSVIVASFGSGVVAWGVPGTVMCVVACVSGLWDCLSVPAVSFGSGVAVWGEPGTFMCVCGNGKVHDGHGVLLIMTRWCTWLPVRKEGRV